MATKYAGKMNAPDFPSSVQWLNTPRPLTLEDFKGKLLLLDFWTYCRISCMQVITALRRLESRYPTELAVVGVHSAKFNEERATDNIRMAIVRYGVSHPVVNDASMEIWRSYAVHAWPTLLFVDPTGKVIGRIEGELTLEQGVQLVDEMLAKFREDGTLHPGRAVFEEEPSPLSILRFPGKIVADAETERLFIADSGHHRVLVTDLEGTVQTIIGSGEEGLVDGVLEGARFAGPQGMAVAGDALYVADTENHAIRYVDLEAGVVETIAGTGRAGAGRVEGGQALEVDLRSPWDLTLVGRSLYVAMAGSHQIWTLDLDTHVMQAAVGTGAEGIIDGPPEEAALAQPSGITADEDDVLYFADSETSSIRSADLVSAHHVATLVGEGLFDFGDQDGDGARAKLQHPLGVDYADGFVYVADTYNHKIKRIGAETRIVATLAGSGSAGLEDGTLTQASFYEPGGLSVAEGLVYVADTNNHAVRVIDLGEGRVRTLRVDL